MKIIALAVGLLAFVGIMYLMGAGLAQAGIPFSLGVLAGMVFMHVSFRVEFGYWWGG